jgi:chitinase
MLAAKVELTGANIMTMDYGAGRPPAVSMLDGSLQAVDATAQQIITSYAATGVTLTSEQAYDKVGVTPMIGQNDTQADRLTTADAQGLADGSRSRGVRRMSMWSLNRDANCGGNLDGSIVNNVCSGVEQTRFQFSTIFGASKARPSTVPAPGPDEVAIATTTTAPVAAGRTPATVVPGHGPYADWRPRREYDTYAKVVWEGQVYQAKWWNVGSQPNSSLKNEWDSPWRMLGPVLADDVAAPVAILVTLPPGTYPEWSLGTVYFGGEFVLFEGVGYKAKWWTRGDNPNADVDNPWESPWAPVNEPPPPTAEPGDVPPATPPGAAPTTTVAPGPAAAP